MSKKLFTNEIEKEIKRKYEEEGLSTCVLGNKYKCHSTTIKDIVKRQGGKMMTKGRRKGFKCSDATKRKQSESSLKGRIQDKKGYWWVMVDDHPYGRKRGNHFFVQEHRFVMEQWLRKNDNESAFLIEYIGRSEKFLDPKIDTHHKNRITTDNRISNLECLSMVITLDYTRLV